MTRKPLLGLGRVSHEMGMEPQEDGMATWHDVDRVRRQHPSWCPSQIAAEIGCLPEYVRATARRRGWSLPTGLNGEYVYLRVLRETVEPLCRDGEPPYYCLRRIVHRALVIAGRKRAA